MILRLLSTLLLLFAGFPARVQAAGAKTVVNMTAEIASAEKALRESQRAVSSVESILDSAEVLISQEAAAFEKSYMELEFQTREVEQLVRDVNAKQLQMLANKLVEIKDRELERREREDVINGDGVTLSELKQLFKPENILKESEAKIEEWILGIVETEMLELEKDMVAASSPSAPENCVTPEQALNVVHGALLKHNRDDIGLIDHAQGATILHEFTSETYTPPPEHSQLLGNVWWRKYIPEDWERALPIGWEGWNVGLSSSLFHTVQKGGASTAAPETILHPNVLPGSCWPMQGKRGNVMISLPYPVQVTAITLDHASHYLLTDSDRQLKSAPRNVRIFGYPPCQGGDCAGLNFDATKKSLVADIEYDLDETVNIQTFPVENANGKGGGAVAGGSCSSTVEEAACDSGLGLQDEEAVEGLYSAIQVEIVDNWGNEAYTCLYRVRVHGDPEI
jgi:hypothetical protein